MSPCSSPTTLPIAAAAAAAAAAAVLLLLISPSSASKSSRPFAKIYAFGDSFTDTGNTASATGPSGYMFVSNPPYGITFFHHPTNRYSDGRLVIDFVASSLSLPFLPPYLHLKDGRGAASSGSVNFAVAGSTAIEHGFFVRNNLTLDVTPESLGTQLGWFDEFVRRQGCEKGWPETPCKALFGDALFWIGEIGANDYAYSAMSPISSSVIQDLAINRTTRFLQALLNKGAKYVVVQGLPATGCLPLALALAPANDRDNMGCVKSVNHRSQSHNAILQAKIRTLRAHFPHAVIVYFDYWNAHADVIKNSSKFGFKETFKVCCGSGGGRYNFDILNVCGSPSSRSCHDPSRYVNWDGVHLTEAMYKAMAEAFINGTHSRPPFRYLLTKRNRH
ncbi:hypothetical protein Nepgr_018586 [Nepenthes gracilis]|uniref:GDSL esterase/lipase n=1 Tax=Nepenthes gracilis TaxID=150966 RepID=A0AAD3SRR7_NEPGR|nr:hypothetical protein Nepgr_018586 [Nepenthes gracilis]